MGGFRKFGTIAAAWSFGLLLNGVSAAALAGPPVQIAQSAEQTAQNYFYAGFEALQQNRLDDAASMFEGGLQHSPNNAVATYYLAVAYDRLGAFDRAAPLYERAAALAPGTEEGRAAQERLQTARSSFPSMFPGGAEPPAAPQPRSIREVFESSPVAQGGVRPPEPRRSQPLPPPPIGRSTATPPSLTARAGPVETPPYVPPAPAAPAPVAPVAAPAPQPAAAAERPADGVPLDAVSRFSMFGQDSRPGRVPVRMSVDRSGAPAEAGPTSEAPAISPAPAAQPPQVVFDAPPPSDMPAPNMPAAEPSAEAMSVFDTAPAAAEAPVPAAEPPATADSAESPVAVTAAEARPAPRTMLPIEALTAELPRGGTTGDLNARALRFVAARDGVEAPEAPTRSVQADSPASRADVRADREPPRETIPATLSGRSGQTTAADLNQRVIDQLGAAATGDAAGSAGTATAAETDAVKPGTPPEASLQAQPSPERAETPNRIVDLRDPAPPPVERAATGPGVRPGTDPDRAAVSAPSGAQATAPAAHDRGAAVSPTSGSVQPVGETAVRSLNERSLAALAPDRPETPAPSVATPDMRAELSERGGAVAALPLPKDPQSLTLPDGTAYYGDLQDGLPHGTGRLVFKDGSIYVGSFRDGKRSGHGVLEMSGGWRFEGEFENNQYDGLGEMSWPDGATYVGEFRQGERTGRGVYWWPNGAKFEGNFVAGEPDGIGTYFYPDGRAETGTWEKGRLISAG